MLKLYYFEIVFLFLYFFTSNVYSQTNKSEAIECVEQMPEYPGGENAMNSFISKILINPDALKNEVTVSKCYFTFVIDTNGVVFDIQVKKGNPSIDSAVITMIKKMPKWTPGKQNGKPVKVKFHIPLQLCFD